MFVLAMERSTYLTIEHRFPVAIAAESHPFPSRTRKLSPPAPMVLGGRPPGRVGRRRISQREAPARGLLSRPGHSAVSTLRPMAPPRPDRPPRRRAGGPGGSEAKGA